MKYVRAISTSELAPGAMQPIQIEDKRMLLANVDGTYYAIGQKCTHLGANLCDGTLTQGVVECPKHGARFDVRTGQTVGKASILIFKMLPKNVPSYPVKVEGTSVFIGV